MFFSVFGLYLRLLRPIKKPVPVWKARETKGPNLALKMRNNAELGEEAAKEESETANCILRVLNTKSVACL